MKEFIKYFDKEQMYEEYLKISRNVKEYDKITKFKMNDEMRAHFLNDKDEIAEVFTLDEIKEAIRISKICSKKGFYERSMDFYSSFPSSKHAFLFDSYAIEGDKERFGMVPEFSSFLSSFVIGLELKERKYFEIVVRGMLLVYGGIFVEDLMTLYFKKRPLKYVSLPVFDFDNFQYFKKTLMIDGYSVYKDALFYPSLDPEDLDFELGFNKTDYDLNFYHDFFVLGIPKGFLKKNYQPYLVFNVQQIINEKLQFSNDPEKMKKDQEFMDLLSFVGIDIAVLSAWPIWKFGGLSYDDYSVSTKEQLIDGLLSQPFLDYVHDLVRYANKKYKYIPKNEEIYDMDAFEIIKKSLKRKNFLNQFHASRKGINSEFIDGFENALIMDTAVAYKYEAGKLLIHHEGVVYHVSGISSPINENIFEVNLPCVVSLVLIPLKESITYALSIVEYRISMGAGMISAFESELKESVHVHNIDDYYNLKPINLMDKH